MSKIMRQKGKEAWILCDKWLCPCAGTMWKMQVHRAPQKENAEVTCNVQNFMRI